MAETISPITSENAFHLARNYSETEHFHFLEQVNVGNRLTFACESAIIQACFEIKPGETTEVEVCQRIKDYLGNCGVEDSWYNIPVMVLAGSKRIKKMTADTYDEKSPRNDVVISSNDPLLFIDIHPQATAEHLSLKMVNDSHLGWWSNYAVTRLLS